MKKTKACITQVGQQMAQYCTCMTLAWSQSMQILVFSCSCCFSVLLLSTDITNWQLLSEYGRNIKKTANVSMFMIKTAAWMMQGILSRSYLEITWNVRGAAVSIDELCTTGFQVHHLKMLPNYALFWSVSFHFSFAHCKCQYETQVVLNVFGPTKLHIW